jgi:prepilin-type processing-associated H-X9-DG protein
VPILITCECGKQFQAGDENVGRRFACTECGRELVVPKVVADPYGAPLLYEGFEARTSGKAIASLVLGILSFFCSIFAAIPAVILGAMGLSDIGKSKGRLEGKGMAIAGIALGSVGSLLGIAISAALLLPLIQAGSQAAQRAQCINNLKQIGLAMHNFHDKENHLPPATIADARGNPGLSWRVALLPYLGLDSLYQQFKLDEPWDSPNNARLIAQIPPVYICPGDLSGTKGSTHYQAIVGSGSAFDQAPGNPISGFTDGTSNTLLVVEGTNAVPWTRPDDIDLATIAGSIGSRHPGGANALFADGSVRFLKTTINPVLLQALGTRNGGEVVSPISY